MKKQLAIVILAASVGVTACNQSGGTKEEQLAQLKKQQAEIQSKIAQLEGEVKTTAKLGEVPQGAPVPVAATTLSAQPFNSYLEVQGKVDFDQNVSVSPKVPGVLTSVRVKTGDRVSKGQVLATIDATLVEQGIAELKTSLELARTVFEKQQRLWDQKIGTEIQYLQAKNNKEALERRISTLREQYAQYQIKAPISGVIDEFNPKVGEAVTPGSPVPVARIVNPTGLKIIADIAEVHAGKIDRGEQAIVVFPDLGIEFPAKVSVVSQAINASTRSFPIELSVNNKEGNLLRPNMVAVVKVREYSNPEAVVVPVNVVQKDETGSFVYVAQKANNGYVVRKRKIEPGVTYGGKTEVRSGLAAQDRIITAGYQNLNEGQPIVI